MKPLSTHLTALFLMTAATQLAAQTTVTLSAAQPEIQLTDPQGSGRSVTLAYAGGQGALSFGTGNYAGTVDPFYVGGALGFFNVVKGQLTAAGGASVSETFQMDDFDEEVRVGAQLSTSMPSLGLVANGSSAGQIAMAGLGGGLSISVPRITGTSTGGAALMANLRVDLAAGHVIADLSGTKSAISTQPIETYALANAVLWTFDTVSDVAGPTRLDPVDLLSADPVSGLSAKGFTVSAVPNQQATYSLGAVTTISNLSITTTGRDFFAYSLGMLLIGSDALNAVNTSPGKWGKLTLNSTFCIAGGASNCLTALPEPSTYVLMGLGLVGIAWASRVTGARAKHA